MRRLLLLILVAALGWFGSWFIGAQGVEKNTLRWFESRQKAGWIASYSGFNLHGFPNRFDLTFTDLNLSDPATGWAWTSDFFQLFMLRYNSNHLIAVWGPEQQLATPIANLRLSNTDMRASLVLQSLKTLALDRSSFVIKDPVLLRADQSGVQADMVSLAIQRQDALSNSYKIALSAKGLGPLATTQNQIDPQALLPRHMQLLKADLTVEFDRPWDRSALETQRPQPTVIDLHLAEAAWGAVALKVTGQLRIDAGGWPKGEITIKASQWRNILNFARTTGKMPEPVFDLIEKALEFISRLNGQDSSLDLTLTLKQQQVFLGPLAISPAPRFKLR